MDIVDLTNDFSRALTFSVNPILRWAGSKKKLVPTILSLAPVSFRRYIEPFVGSACVFAAVAPKNAIISDINAELIFSYSILRLSPREIYDVIADLPTDANAYYAMREIPPESLDDITRAARFIYLNRYCFNGVYRTNLSGMFNVPRGTRTGDMPSIQAFIEFSNLLKRTKIINEDFQKILSRGQVGDFAYLDPPYVEPGTRFRGEYGYGSFRSEDEERLVAELLTAHSRGVGIVLSYNDRLLDMLPGWRKESLTIRRSVGGFGQRRKCVTEVLYTNIPKSLTRGFR